MTWRLVSLHINTELCYLPENELLRQARVDVALSGRQRRLRHHVELHNAQIELGIIVNVQHGQQHTSLLLRCLHAFSPPFAAFAAACTALLRDVRVPPPPVDAVDCSPRRRVIALAESGNSAVSDVADELSSALFHLRVIVHYSIDNKAIHRVPPPASQA